MKAEHSACFTDGSREYGALSPADNILTFRPIVGYVSAFNVFKSAEIIIVKQQFIGKMNRISWLCSISRLSLPIVLGSLKVPLSYRPVISQWTNVKSTIRRSISTDLQNSSKVNTVRAGMNINETQLVKDVIVFKYENPKFFRILNIFAISQFVFWTFMSTSTFKLRSTPVEHLQDREDLAWWRKVNLHDYRYYISIGCGLVGE